MPQNNLWWALIRSLSIIIAISLTLGLGTYQITNNWVSGIIMFIMSIIAQFAINSIVSSISDKKNKEAEFLAQQVLKEASERKLPYDLNCAYCNTINRVGISFDNENVFECSACEQPNKIYLQFTTVRITAPLTQKENIKGYDDEEDSGVKQTNINEPVIIS